MIWQRKQIPQTLADFLPYKFPLIKKFRLLFRLSGKPNFVMRIEL